MNDGWKSGWRRSVMTVVSWLLSMTLHGLTLVVIFWFNTRSIRGLPEPEAKLEVGIVAPAEPEAPALVHEPTPLPAELPRRIFDDPPPSAAPAPTPTATTTLPSDPSPVLRPPTNLTAPPMPLAPGETFSPPGKTNVQFINTKAVGKSFVFVIDRSASMGYLDALGFAKESLLISLKQLGPEHQFQVVMYNTKSEALPWSTGKLLAATRINVDNTRKHLDGIEPKGGTNHRLALSKAFDLKPEVIFYLTDADDMTADDVQWLTSQNQQRARGATIHAIQFGAGAGASHPPLRQLAVENDGTYNYVNTFMAP